MSQPPGGGRPCSTASMPEAPSRRIYGGEAVHAATCGNFREERYRANLAKHEKREALYDFPDALKSRMALQDKILRSSPGRSKKNESPQRRPDELVGDWLSAERRHADELAEQHWKAKFVEWHRKLCDGEDAKFRKADECAPNKRRSLSGSEEVFNPSVDLASSWPGLDPNDPEAIAIRKQTESYKQETTKLITKQAQVEHEISRYKAELQAEQQRRVHVENLLGTAIEERDAWSASASRHELMRKRSLNEHKEASSQVAELNSQLGAISKTLTVQKGSRR